MKNVKFSVQLSARCSSLEDWETLKSIALECEELGYHSIWFGDHLATGESRLECWTILSALSTITKKIRLGPLVLCNNFRNPALLAKMAASLDVISKGRLEFGIGAGGNREEHEAYGFGLPEPRVRIGRLKEGVEIIRRMWTEEKPSYHGKYYDIRDVLCEPKPLQKPYPPITIGGGGEKRTLKVVAAYADRWNAFGSLDQYLQKMKILERYCYQIGRDPQEIEKSYMFPLALYRDESELMQRMKKDYESMPMGRDISFEKWMDMTRSRYILGTPDEWLEKICEIIDLGITHFVIGSERRVTNKRTEDLRLFAEKVISQLNTT